MATAKEIMDIALREEGTKDNGNNLVKYNTEYYGRAVQGATYLWCCVFVWWVFFKAGASKLFLKGKKTARCTVLRDSMKHRKVSEPRYGDLVFFNWNGKHDVANHVGFFIRKVGNNRIETMDGNTSDSNDGNGGCVMRRIRYTSCVDCYIRPEYDEEEPVNEIPAEEKIYVVKKGDSLSKIAASYKIRWQDIAEENDLKNPNLIYPGQKLKIP